MNDEERKLHLQTSESYGSDPGEFMVRGGETCYLRYPERNRQLITIELIAHALSNLCRFNGHTSEFYSVAQHSVLVSQHCKVAPVHALLHDASEAFLGDVIRPIKYTNALNEYRHYEKRWQQIIFEAFGLEPEMPEEVHLADNQVLIAEFRDLFDKIPDTIDDLEPYPHTIKPLPPKAARYAFMRRWRELTDEEFDENHDEVGVCVHDPCPVCDRKFL